MAVSKELINQELELAREFLRDADMLLKADSLRSSESRAYYSITHKGTISLFGKEVVKKGIVDREYAKIIGRAFSRREEADYQSGIFIEQEGVKTLVNDAKRFVTEAAMLLKSKKV
ncbi:MAG: hypothetical protein DRO76_05140 [Candidatus Altiarchaeales archaeon]|nr:MAG: hypothetical protein DRO76_05140 [Candidatus Altiarchaeales archaeon]